MSQGVDDADSYMKGSSLALVERDDAHKPKECWGTRHTLATMGFLGFAVVYAMRVNLSVAIVAMVREEAATGANGSSSDGSSDACAPPDDPDSGGGGDEGGGEFDWDEELQGHILGSFFYGYLITNFVGGRGAEYLGGKIVYGLGVLLTSILTMVSPLCARASPGLFIGIRVLEGLTEGVTFPAMNYLLATWIPPSERAKFTSLVYCGVQFGTVITQSVTGFLCDSDFLGGWPSAFYVFGGVGVLWSAAWFFLVFDHPGVHPRISREEKRYVVRHCGERRKEPVPVPWASVLASPAVWALAVTHFCNNWGFYTLLTELPTYLRKIQHLDIKSNGLLSSLPYLSMWVFSLAYSNAINHLLSAGRIDTRSVRRISMFVGEIGPMAGLVAMCFVGCDSALAVTVLCLSVGLNGSIYCGYMCSHQDLSPNLAGSLMGLTNTVATVPGIVAPVLTGVVTEGNQTLSAWRTVFLIAAGMYVVAYASYFFLVPATVQPWNEVQETRKDSQEAKGGSNERY